MSNSEKQKIINDISTSSKTKTKVISLRREKKEIASEKERVLGYQKMLQLRPKLIDLRTAFAISRARDEEQRRPNSAAASKAAPFSFLSPASSSLPLKNSRQSVQNTNEPYFVLKKEALLRSKNALSSKIGYSGTVRIKIVKTSASRLQNSQDSKSLKRASLSVFDGQKSARFRARSVLPFLMVAVFLTFAVRSLAYVEINLKEKKNKILDEVNVASQYFFSGKDSILENDYSLASYKFKIAGERFSSASRQIGVVEKSISSILMVLPKGSAASSAVNLLEAGGNVSFAAESLSSGFLTLNNTQDIFASIKGKPQEEGKMTFTNGLVSAFEDFGRANLRLNSAHKQIERVKLDGLSSEQAAQVEEIKKTITEIKSNLSYFLENADYLLEILGHNRPKKYMLFFENSRELRPTGGFLGTYGIFDMNEGRIENFKIQSPYVVSGQLMDKIQAPEPLRLIQPKFNFHDANWFFDFPTSAKKIILLHEKAGWPTADGVLVVSGAVMPELLKITGPISMPEYNSQVNAENFFDVTQKEVEVNYDKKLNEPKKFIADLFPKILSRAFELDKDGQVQAMRLFLDQLYKKNILFYFQDEKLERMILDWGFGGEIKKTNGDYFAMVLTNIGGGKTDHAVDYKIHHQAEIQSDGRVIDAVTITKKHNGSLGDYWTSVKNMDYMRIYVPAGSQLLEAKGFDAQFFNPDLLQPYEDGSRPDPDLEKEKTIHEPSKTRIYQMEGKTVFGNWSGLEVGQEKTITLKYELPFKIKLSGEPKLARFSLFVQRQPGALPFSFSSDLSFPENFEILWQQTKNGNLKIRGSKIDYGADLANDRGYGLVFREKNHQINK